VEVGLLLASLEIVAPHSTYSLGRYPNASHRNALCHFAYELPPGFSSVGNLTQQGWFRIGTGSQKTTISCGFSLKRHNI